MKEGYLIHIVRFVFLLLLQGLILDKLPLNSGWIMPFPYIYALLLLPFTTMRWLLLLIGFVYGICLDMFSNTLGMHTSASVFIAFMIPYIQNFIAPIEGYSISNSPTIKSRGWSWFLIYASSLTLLHHIWLFIVESFQFANFLDTLTKIAVSTILSLLLIILFQFFSFNSQKAKS